MSWNIGANSVFEDPGPRGFGRSDGGRPARFHRLVKAVAPDVVCLQEVYPPRTASDVARLLDAALPLVDGQRWQAHGDGDVVIATRFPLSMLSARTEDWGSGRPRTHLMALVDLPDTLDIRDLYAVCAHFQSRGEPQDIRARQEQADAIAAWVRDLRTPGGLVDLPARTPMVLMGDWNAYKTDPAAHVSTLLGGQIAHQARFGQGGPPDWDDTSLVDPLPVHNSTGPASYTFGDGSGAEFPPAALDRFAFTDSVLQSVGSFVLDTTALSTWQLERFGLLADDVLLHAENRTFDHLPIAVDLSAVPPVPHRGAPVPDR